VRSVFRWLAGVVERGQNPLRAKPISGRPPKASEKQMCWQAQAVKDNAALPFRVAYGLWTLSLIVLQFEQQFGKITNLEMLSNFLGWKLQTANSICSGR
jgi:transposase